MLTWGWHNPEGSEALLERCKSISVPKGQDLEVLLPEGSEALRAGVESHNPMSQGY